MPHSRPQQHYTEQPSELTASTCPEDDGGVLHLRGGGFVTREMVDAALRAWERGDAAGLDVLVDLRDVAGYDSGCVHLAAQWLHDAHRRGVRRIAFLASSSVLRTATRLAAERSRVDLRTFEHEPAARAWLSDGTGPARARIIS